MQKPIFGREGANVQFFEQGKLLLKTDGPYDGPSIYQEVCPLPQLRRARLRLHRQLDRQRLGVRHGDSRRRESITGNLSRFVPHLF